MSDDGVGCILFLAIGGAAWWASQHYEIRKIEAKPTTPAEFANLSPEPIRPTGMIAVTTDQDGIVWQLDADSVSGGRQNRQGWLYYDYSHRKQPRGRTRSARELQLVDCETGGSRKLSYLSYDAKGNSLFAESLEQKDAKVSYYPPQTLGSKIVTALCQRGFDAAKPMN